MRILLFAKALDVGFIGVFFWLVWCELQFSGWGCGGGGEKRKIQRGIHGHGIDANLYLCGKRKLRLIEPISLISSLNLSKNSKDE